MGAIFDHYTSTVILKRAGHDALGRLDDLEARVARLERSMAFQQRDFRGVIVYGNPGRLVVRPSGRDRMLELGSSNDSISVAGGAGGGRGRINIYTGIA